VNSYELMTLMIIQDALQPRLLWETVSSLFNSQILDVAKHGDSIEALELIDILLDNLSLKDIKVETCSHFSPCLLLANKKQRLNLYSFRAFSSLLSKD